MKTIRVLIMAALFMAAVGFIAGADDNATPPMLGQPGSLLEVYGLIDLGMHVSTNADPAGETFFGFSQGLLNGSRWGLRGTESIGGGFKAIYTLEGGVVVPSGAIDQQGQIFGRQAWVGVSSDYGTLTFGRQYGTFSDAIGAGDVFGTGHGNGVYSNSGANYGGNDAVNAFFLSESGLRFDDSIKYAANFSGVTVGAMIVPGQLMGTTAPVTIGTFPGNSMVAGSLGYNSKNLPISGAAGAQAEVDTLGGVHTVMGLGLKFALDPTDAVYAFYLHSSFDHGFQKIQNGDSEFGQFGIADTFSSFGRTDDIANLAVNYYVTPSVNLIASYYFDYAQNVLAAGDTGMRNSILGVVDCYFSKEFDAYLGGSYTNFTDALQNAGFNNGKTALGGDWGANATTAFSSVVSVYMGARYRF